MKAFNRLLTRERMDKLESDGGVCIVSTHLGKGFAADGKIDQETGEILRYLSRKSGWFVPVSEILDHLRKRQTGSELNGFARLKLEYLYILDKLHLAL